MVWSSQPFTSSTTTTKESMSANLRRALKKLEEKGGSLDDLPTNREATDWNVIAAESSLGPLKLVVLKTHREQQAAPGW